MKTPTTIKVERTIIDPEQLHLLMDQQKLDSLLDFLGSRLSKDDFKVATDLLSASIRAGLTTQ